MKQQRDGASKFSLQAGGLYGSNSAKVGDGSVTLLAGLVNSIYGTNFQPKLGWYAYAGADHDRHFAFVRTKAELSDVI